MFPKTSTDAKYAALEGAVAGIAAGGVLTLMMTFMSAVAGHDIWYGMKGAAAPILGGAATGPGFSFLPVMVGLTMHFFISMLWGIGFGFIAYHLDRRTTLIAGGLYGLVVWLGMFYVVLPLVGLSQMAAEAPVVKNALYHVFFGLSIAVPFLALEIEEDRDRSAAYRLGHASA
jgi:hypothetical protein